MDEDGCRTHIYRNNSLLPSAGYHTNCSAADSSLGQIHSLKEAPTHAVVRETTWLQTAVDSRVLLVFAL